MDPIFEAVLEGEEAVARLLREDAAHARRLAARDQQVEAIPHWLYVGDSGLHLAAAALQVGSARVLLASGADPNAANRRGATPLHYTCDPRPRGGGAWNPPAQEALIRLLARHGAEIDRPDRGGATPLHRAVRARSAAAVRQLLELGAEPNCRLKQRSSTPLHLATQPTGAGATAGSLAEQLQIIGLLLEHGGDPEAGDSAGRTPRDWARNAAVVQALSRHA